MLCLTHCLTLWGYEIPGFEPEILYMNSFRNIKTYTGGLGHRVLGISAPRERQSLRGDPRGHRGPLVPPPLPHGAPPPYTRKPQPETRNSKTEPGTRNPKAVAPPPPLPPLPPLPGAAAPSSADRLALRAHRLWGNNPV